MLRALFPLALFLTAGQCGTPSDAGDGGTSSDGGAPTITCQNDSRVAVYAPGMSATTGGRTFVLVSSDPTPPARGVNNWTVRLLDSAGNALKDQAFDVTPFMPDHGHGSTVKATATANGDGTYAVGPLSFFMPGVWRVTFSVLQDGGTSQDAAFFFCVAG